MARSLDALTADGTFPEAAGLQPGFQHTVSYYASPFQSHRLLDPFQIVREERTQVRIEGTVPHPCARIEGLPQAAAGHQGHLGLLQLDDPARAPVGGPVAAVRCQLQGGAVLPKTARDAVPF